MHDFQDGQHRTSNQIRSERLFKRTCREWDCQSGRKHHRQTPRRVDWIQETPAAIVSPFLYYSMYVLTTEKLHIN